MQVKVWQEKINIPTYKTGNPDKNPMFLEKRVYQGSSGAVYPHAVIDKVYDQKEDKTYHAVFLENEYLRIMILPELGGRVQMALDKTNGYHFVYYNTVIKPALVGLAGPWISGGIEFNWPQHHRPSTYSPVDFCIEENGDGSKTVWVSEIEQMFHTKGMAGFTLYPGRAYLEIKGRLYNRTALPQTFLWWANPAVAVDETYQSVFPPDVNAVYDHGKRDVSSFPVATGTYYKVDYSPGTDISWYKNIPVPTSYMAVNSDFDFLGGYNHGVQAGILHVASHHISPGKKQWTWGSGEFGKAWDRQLTDEDGPYFELMTGVFTDNQPDFGWILPNEERNFRQYFMPYKNIGYVRNATVNAMVNLETDNETVTIKVYVTAVQKNTRIQLFKADEMVSEDVVDLSPVNTYAKSIRLLHGFEEDELHVNVFDDKKNLLVHYHPVSAHKKTIPEPAKPIDIPANIPTIEGLYLAGMHLEQYRHATCPPLPYYEEALRRDATDIRNNNAAGLWYLRRGQFEKAAHYFRTAFESQTRFNTNPSDGEIIYNLGLSLFYSGKMDNAYDLFYKATWNAAWQDKSFFYLARIDAQRKEYLLALDHLEQSIIKNYHGMQPRHLKAAVLRKLSRYTESENFIKETLAIDPFDFGSGNELYLLLKETGRENNANTWLTGFTRRISNGAHTAIEIAIDYGHAGLYEEAVELLNRVSGDTKNPFHLYYLAFFTRMCGDKETAANHALTAFSIPVGDIFSNRLEDIAMLNTIVSLNPGDYKALYHLGNIWYDKRQYAEAIEAWERAREICPAFPTVNRNLGIAYFNRLRLEEEALKSYEKAFLSDPSDSRVFFELDQLRKRINYTTTERLNLLREYPQLIEERDDLFIEYVTLHNLLGEYDKALTLLSSRNFHPWEGGEGKAAGQYVTCCIELAKAAINEGRVEESISLLHNAQTYPANLGEGKLFGAQENDVYYWLGCAHEKAGRTELAQACWEKAASGPLEPSPALFYNDNQPDKIFYHSLALLKLDRYEAAMECFTRLVQYGEEHIDDDVKIDYFAVSLPGLMIFDDDLNARNKIHCHYLTALGQFGLGNEHSAKKYFDEVLKMDQSHAGAILHMAAIQNGIFNGAFSYPENKLNHEL